MGSSTMKIKDGWGWHPTLSRARPNDGRLMCPAGSHVSMTCNSLWPCAVLGGHKAFAGVWYLGMVCRGKGEQGRRVLKA